MLRVHVLQYSNLIIYVCNGGSYFQLLSVAADVSITAHEYTFALLFLCFLFYRASEIAHFQQVLKHPAYKANPLGAISEHIKNALQKELENKT